MKWCFRYYKFCGKKSLQREKLNYSSNELLLSPDSFDNWVQQVKQWDFISILFGSSTSFTLKQCSNQQYKITIFINRSWLKIPNGEEIFTRVLFWVMNLRKWIFLSSLYKNCVFHNNWNYKTYFKLSFFMIIWWYENHK